MSEWRPDDVATIWRYGRPAGIYSVTAVAGGLVTLSDGSQWVAASGAALTARHLGATIAHTASTDADFVERARHVARVRELLAKISAGDRLYKVDTETLIHLERVAVRARATQIRANWRNKHNTWTDAQVSDTLAREAEELRRAEALELEAKWREK